MEKIHCVARQHLASLVFGHAGELFCNQFQRLRPTRNDVREIGRPHDPVDADHVAKLDTDRVIEHAPMRVLTQVLARQFFQLGKSEKLLRPMAIDPVNLIHLLVEVRDPADIVFRPKYLQLRKSNTPVKINCVASTAPQ